MKRREMLGVLGAGITATASRQLTVNREPLTVNDGEHETLERSPTVQARGTSVGLKQSVSRWCYDTLTLDQLCVAAKDIGLAAIDLLDPAEYEVPKKHGLVCAMSNGFGTIPRGFNRPDQHDKLVADGEAMIPLAAAAGVPNVVVFSGNRQGLGDGEGLANCIAGLKRLAPTAEKHGVTLCLELLNSKVDHRDYQCDHTAWGAEVVKGVGSSRLKLLYDIYHMQIMEGDVVRTIRNYAPFIGHYHTGGVPGRNEIDESQELNYRRIAQAIVDTGYAGFLAHEFVPKRDPLTSLRAAVQRCAV
ncbi:MAG: TIM barrel protein [Gemmatimonadetes bacterium]|nr:TIM barrel protein [Gemmatimonadota bacterium]